MSHAAPGTLLSGDAATLATRYAGALYELADEGNVLDAVTADLRNLQILLRESAELRAIAAHPRLTRTQLVTAAKAVTTAAKLNPLTGNFLSLLGHNRRLSILGGAIACFLAQLAKRRGEHTAEVASAQPMSAQQQEQLTAKLRDLTGGKVFLSISENKNLLGGFTVKLGSRFIDASIKTKLMRLERQLKSGHAA